MLTQKIIDLLNDGKKPLVKLNDHLWDESFGAKGMIARIVSYTFSTHENTFDVKFDYSENREQNIALDQPTWYLGAGNEKGTALEAGAIGNDLTETVYFESDQEMPVELIDSHLLQECIDEKSGLTYVEWLEKKVETLERLLEISKRSLYE